MNRGFPGGERGIPGAGQALDLAEAGAVWREVLDAEVP